MKTYKLLRWTAVLMSAVLLLLAVPIPAAAANKVSDTDGFVLIKGGTFSMGSPSSENWRSTDEKRHRVTVDDFYMGIHEVTQAEYRNIMGKNPSRFSGSNLPVETVSWLDAVRYCNRRSRKEGLAPAYKISGSSVTWNRRADGYRLPAEAEWEYACRAGTTGTFNTKTSISASEANYYGHYPYGIEENYFSEEKLETKPGNYREKTVPVNRFSPNAWGFITCMAMSANGSGIITAHTVR